MLAGLGRTETNTHTTHAHRYHREKEKRGAEYGGRSVDLSRHSVAT